MRQSCFLLAAFIAIFPTLLSAQKPGSYPTTLFVTYTGSPIYTVADHKSDILGNLRLGDSVTALGVAGKFFRIRFQGGEGYVLGTNLSMTPSKSRKKERVASRKDSLTADSTRTISSGKRRKKREVIDAASDSGTAEAGKRKTKRPRTARSRIPEELPADSTSQADTSAPASPPAKERSGSKATVTRCRATTKSGTQCSRTTDDPSGYCWQHKK